MGRSKHHQLVVQPLDLLLLLAQEREELADASVGIGNQFRLEGDLVAELLVIVEHRGGLFGLLSQLSLQRLDALLGTLRARRGERGDGGRECEGSHHLQIGAAEVAGRTPLVGSSGDSLDVWDRRCEE